MVRFSSTFTYLIQYHNDREKSSIILISIGLRSSQSLLMRAWTNIYMAQIVGHFIEWPDIAKSLLIRRVCDVSIEYEGESERLLTYTLR